MLYKNKNGAHSHNAIGIYESAESVRGSAYIVRSICKYVSVSVSTGIKNRNSWNFIFVHSISTMRREGRKTKQQRNEMSTQRPQKRKIDWKNDWSQFLFSLFCSLSWDRGRQRRRRWWWCRCRRRWRRQYCMLLRLANTILHFRATGRLPSGAQHSEWCTHRFASAKYWRRRWIGQASIRCRMVVYVIHKHNICLVQVSLTSSGISEQIGYLKFMF